MQKYAALLTASVDGLRQTATHGVAASAFILRYSWFWKCFALLILLFYAVFLFHHFVPPKRCKSS